MISYNSFVKLPDRQISPDSKSVKGQNESLYAVAKIRFRRKVDLNFKYC